MNKQQTYRGSSFDVGWMRGMLISLSPTTLNVGVNFEVTSQIFGCPQSAGIKKENKIKHS
jgi:hypothetical protein